MKALQPFGTSFAARVWGVRAVACRSGPLAQRGQLGHAQAVS